MNMNRVFQGFLYRIQGAFFSQTPRRFFAQATTVKKAEEVIRQVSMKKEDILGEQARKLIFGNKKYPDFSPREKRIVDLYQKKMLEVDGGVILPNTKADLERAELEQVLSSFTQK